MGDPAYKYYQDKDGSLYKVPVSQASGFLDGGISDAREISESQWHGLEHAADSAPSTVSGDGADAGTFGPMEPDRDAASGAYDLPRKESSAPYRPPLPAPIETSPPPVPVSHPPTDLENSARALREIRDQRGALPNDARTTRRGVDAPLKGHQVNDLESFGRGAGDRFSYGFGDQMAGLGGMLQMSGVLPRGAPPRTLERGFDAPVVPRTGAEYAGAYNQQQERYDAENKLSAEEDPGLFTAGEAAAAVPLSFLERGIGKAASGVESTEAARLAGPEGGFGARAIAGAKDALFNRGNKIAAVVSGAGHSEGEGLDRLGSAVKNANTELATGAVTAPLAEALLSVPRAFGRGTNARLQGGASSNVDTQTLATAQNVGVEPEAFAKPRDAKLLDFSGGPRTSERGVRLSEEMHDRNAQLLGRTGGNSSAQAAEELRAQAAHNITESLERQRSGAVNTLATEKQRAIASPQGQQQLDLTSRGPQTPGQASLGIPISDRQMSPRTYLFAREPLDPPIAAKGPGQPLATLNAEQLDRKINLADDNARAYTGKKEPGEAASWAAIADQLRALRNQHFTRLSAANREGSDELGRLQDNLSQFNIPENVSPIRATRNSPHTKQAYDQLAQYAHSPMLRETVDGLARHGADPDLIRQSAGHTAAQTLISEAQANRGPVRFGLGRFYAPLAAIDPGMRAAGLQNLGLNSQGAVRAAELQYMLYLLGVRPPGQSSEVDPGIK